MMLSAALERCPTLAEELKVLDAAPRVRSVRAALQSALLGRAEKLNPGLRVQDVKTLLDAWLDDQRQKLKKAFPANKICKIASAATLKLAVERLDSARISKMIAEYATAEVIYNKAVPVTGHDGLQTFALPEFQKLVFATIMGSHFDGGDCRALKIETVDMVTSETVDALNLPVFMKPPLKYEEKWDVSCGGVNKSFRLNFMRDSDQMKGFYGIKVIP